MRGFGEGTRAPRGYRDEKASSAPLSEPGCHPKTSIGSIYTHDSAWFSKGLNANFNSRWKQWSLCHSFGTSMYEEICPRGGPAPSFIAVFSVFHAASRGCGWQTAVHTSSVGARHRSRRAQEIAPSAPMFSAESEAQRRSLMRKPFPVQNEHYSSRVYTVFFCIP